MSDLVATLLHSHAPQWSPASHPSHMRRLRVSTAVVCVLLSVFVHEVASQGEGGQGSGDFGRQESGELDGNGGLGSGDFDPTGLPQLEDLASLTTTPTGVPSPVPTTLSPSPAPTVPYEITPTEVCDELDNCAESSFFDTNTIESNVCSNAGYAASVCEKGVSARDDWLTQTNRVRCTYCSDKMLWDDQLALSAQGYVDSLLADTAACGEIGKDTEGFGKLGDEFREIVKSWPSVSVGEVPNAQMIVRMQWENDLTTYCDLEDAMCTEEALTFATMVYQYTEMMGCGYEAWFDESLDSPSTHCNVLVCRFKLNPNRPLKQKTEVDVMGNPMVVYQNLYDKGALGQWFYKPQGECQLFPRTMEFGYTCEQYVEAGLDEEGGDDQTLPCGVESTYILLGGQNWRACSKMMEQGFSYISCACLNSIELTDLTKEAMGCRLEGGNTLLEAAEQCLIDGDEEIEYENTYELTAVEYRAKKSCQDENDALIARSYPVKVTLDFCFEYDPDAEGIQEGKRLPAGEKPSSQIVTCGDNGTLTLKYYLLAGCLGAPIRSVDLSMQTCEELINERGKSVRRSWTYDLPDTCESASEDSEEKEEKEKDYVAEFLIDFDGTFTSYKSFCAEAFSDDRKGCRECGGKIRKDRNDNTKICLLKEEKKLKCKQISTTWCQKLGCKHKEGAKQCRGTPVFDEE